MVEKHFLYHRYSKGINNLTIFFSRIFPESQKLLELVKLPFKEKVWRRRVLIPVTLSLSHTHIQKKKKKNRKKIKNLY